MSTDSEISQRDLRLRSKEIMDAVERGQTYTVTRDGRHIAALVPLRPRRFVTREQFAVAARNAPHVDVERFRAEQDAALDQDVSDPFDR